MSKTYEKYWLALAIGNSRLHWACLEGNTLVETWDRNHLSEAIANFPQYFDNIPLPPTLLNRIPIYIASVVPQQTDFWQHHSAATEITLAQIPLKGIYPTMGIDRALTLWGGIQTYNVPVLVIDAGTALTFTGGISTPEPTLVGGAILPGLSVQLQSLHRQTAALPTVQLPQRLPKRWAANTPNAIASGIIYTVLAGIQDFATDWLAQFPDSKIIFTGGDAPFLLNYLKRQFPELARNIAIDPQLIFWGMRSVRATFQHRPGGRWRRDA